MLCNGRRERARSGLYGGTAGYYDRFRPRYPPEILDALLAHVRPDGRGRLLDLGCGTGQIAFALRDAFAEVWTVDQEPDMIEVVREKAAAVGVANLRAVMARAEELAAPAEAFALITMGNAFHRFDRDTVAARAFGWLEPGGWLALLWSTVPWNGDTEWQRAMAEAVEHWQERLWQRHRVPTGWDLVRRERPDVVVLEDAGFEFRESHTASVERAWKLEELAGFVYSTSILSLAVLGRHQPAFEADLNARLQGYAWSGGLVGTIHFAAEISRRPQS